MGKYKFENDNNNFGETRRLDTIHKEVQKIEKDIKNRKIDMSSIENSMEENKIDTVFGINKKIAVIIVVICALFIICGCYVISKMHWTAQIRHKITVIHLITKIYCLKITKMLTLFHVV